MAGQMTAEEYEELPAAGAMQCPHCGEMLSLEEVFLQLTGKDKEAAAVPADTGAQS